MEIKWEEIPGARVIEPHGQCLSYSAKWEEKDVSVCVFPASATYVNLWKRQGSERIPHLLHPLAFAYKERKQEKKKENNRETDPKGTCWCILEPAKRLVEHLRETKISWTQKLTWLYQIGKTLAFLHEEDLVHGAVTASHILLIPSQGVNGDLVATTLPPMFTFFDCKMFSQRFEVPQAIGYLPPENLSGTPQITAAMDVYGYAMLMYLMVAGHEPWDKFTLKTFAHLSYALASGKRPTLPKGCMFPSLEYKKLLEQCWNQEHEQRPRMSDVIQTLSCFIEEAKKAGPEASTFGLSSQPLIAPPIQLTEKQIQEKEERHKDHAVELYEVGKTFMRNQDYLAAYKYFKEYNEHITAGLPVYRQTHEDFHLFYLAICCHRLHGDYVKNEWKDLFCEWVYKHSIDLTERHPPPFLVQALEDYKKKNSCYSNSI